MGSITDVSTADTGSLIEQGLKSVGIKATEGQCQLGYFAWAAYRLVEAVWDRKHDPRVKLNQAQRAAMTQHVAANAPQFAKTDWEKGLYAANEGLKWAGAGTVLAGAVATAPVTFCIGVAALVAARVLKVGGTAIGLDKLGFEFDGAEGRVNANVNKYLKSRNY